MTPAEYMRASRARKDARGECRYCPAPARPDRVDCGCQARRQQASLTRYIPLDELLATPRIRTLRALRWFDWVAASDLLVALDVDDTGRVYAAALHHLARTGLVERDRSQWVPRYKIAQRGRDALVERMAQYERTVAA